MQARCQEHIAEEVGGRIRARYPHLVCDRKLALANVAATPTSRDDDARLHGCCLLQPAVPVRGGDCKGVPASDRRRVQNVRCKTLGSSDCSMPNARPSRQGTRCHGVCICVNAYVLACVRVCLCTCVCACLSAFRCYAKSDTDNGAHSKVCGADGNDVLGTIFPMPAGQGSSWNRSAVRTIAAAIAIESRASGADRGFSPELQVATDPRFGRTQENFGGDPFLVSELGVAAVLGLHGGDTAGPGGYLPNYNTTITSEAKHYAAYGAIPLVVRCLEGLIRFCTGLHHSVCASVTC